MSLAALKRSSEKREEVFAGKQEIRQDVIARFSSELNISQEDLEDIEGFDRLSSGQQMLALDNLHQLLLAQVEEEGESRQQAEHKKLLSISRLKAMHKAAFR